MTTLLTEMSWLSLLLLCLAAFVTSMIHGATGIAGGFLLAAFATPLLDIKAIVPILSVTLLISHGSRAVFNIKNFNREAYLTVVFPAAPCIIAAALIYGKLSGATIAFLLGTVVLLSLPLRRWAQAKQFNAGKPTLGIAGAIYGGVSGASIGPGMLLVPVLLGFGLGREAFVATLAAIALTTNLIRTSVYGFSELLTPDYMLVGIITGLATIPGTWVGRGILRNLTDRKHIMAVEWLVVIGGLNFYWLGFRLISV